MMTRLAGAVVLFLAVTAAIAAYGWHRERVGYQRAVQERSEAIQQSKERADEIRSEVDGATDDDLVDGLLKPN